MPSIYETPERRSVKVDAQHVQVPEDVPDWMMTRVENKSPRGRRCIIEGVSGEKATNVCHGYPRAMITEEEIMRGIEYNMGMRLGTMNLNTSGNLFHANAAAHWLLDRGRYALIPSDEILDLFLEPYPMRSTFEGVWQKVLSHAEYADGDKIKKKTPLFEYTLIPMMREMEDVIFMHEHDGTPGQQDVTIHRYPYTDFPKIKSHVKPQFLLLSLGHQLRDKDEDELRTLEQEFSPKNCHVPFEQIALLYRFWTKAPKNWMYDESFCDAGMPFPEEKDDLKDRNYRPSGSVASSKRTQQKRQCKGYSKNAATLGSDLPSPSRSLFSGGRSALSNQVERKSAKRARTEDNGSQDGV